MNLVIDTSIVIAVVTNERDKQRIIDITRGFSLVAPLSLYPEVINAFSAMFRRGRISLDDARSCYIAAKRISMRMHTPDLEKSLVIAHDLGIYAYDAYFLECARAHSSPLLTLDTGLVYAAKRYGIETYEV